MTVSGGEAVVQWGYHTAGTVRQWTITKADDGSLALHAVIGTVDTFRVTQRPLVFVATHQHGSWRWFIETLQITDGALSARLGPREK